MEQVEAWPAETRRTRADALRDAIAEAIVRGELAPGQRLDEVSVAQRFAVSRTPVREALKQLATMDLVELRPHRGAVVAGLDADPAGRAVRGHGGGRGGLRPAGGDQDVARRAGAVRGGLHPLRRGTASAPTTSRPSTPPTSAFHTAIHQGAHNSFLAEAAWVLRRKLSPLSRAQFGLTGRPDNSAAEHRRPVRGDRGPRRPGRRAGDARPHPQRRLRLRPLDGARRRAAGAPSRRSAGPAAGRDRRASRRGR